MSAPSVIRSFDSGSSRAESLDEDDSSLSVRFSWLKTPRRAVKLSITAGWLCTMVFGNWDKLGVTGECMKEDSEDDSESEESAEDGA